MKEYIWNNKEHNLPIKRWCVKCSINYAKLEAKEDTRGEVKYQYECEYSKCKNIEEVE